MRWLPVMRKDGKKDPYAMGYCTHTVCTVSVGGKEMFEAWRMGKPHIRLGGFPEPNKAQLACEQDANKRQVAA